MSWEPTPEQVERGAEELLSWELDEAEARDLARDVILSVVPEGTVPVCLPVEELPHWEDSEVVANLIDAALKETEGQ